MVMAELELLQDQVTTYRAEGKYKETIEACDLLLTKGKELNDSKSILVAYINRAVSFYCVGAIEEAFHSIESYELISRKFGDDTDRLQLHNTLFLLHEYNKNYVKAKETLQKAIELGKKLQKYNIVSNAYSNLSHVYHVEGNAEEALQMAEIGLEVAKLFEPNSPILEFRVKLNIANAQIALGDMDSSWWLIKEMIQEPILDHFTREKSQCYDLQGRWFTKQKRYREAFDSLTEAKRVADIQGDVHLLKVIQEQRCTLCELLDDRQMGFDVQKEYIDLLKEINDRELALTAMKLDMQHSVASITENANIDYLSGLYNRRFLESTTTDWLQLADMKKESIVCIVLDIDDFKLINDQYGHLYGDEVIRQVGQACSSIIRASDMIGRYGGDEFVIILREMTLEVGREKAAQLAAAIQDLDINKADNMKLTVSIGVADNGHNTIHTFNELFHEADKALYQAKGNGKNQIVRAE